MVDQSQDVTDGENRENDARDPQSSFLRTHAHIFAVAQRYCQQEIGDPKKDWS